MIRVLPPQVADAIAAGEVVERPASVVKELVENAIDAGARRIAVEVRGAGRTLIRVVDDGSGIPPQELRLAFQRHATSKVATLEDLTAITTLGFRGEALASVAAVSDLECRSRGARIRLRAGEVREEGTAADLPGTSIEVRDLFANTPARLKFLKGEATETAACVRTVQAYALLYPEIRFELTVDGRTTLRTAGDGDRRRGRCWARPWPASCWRWRERGCGAWSRSLACPGGAGTPSCWRSTGGRWPRGRWGTRSRSATSARWSAAATRWRCSTCACSHTIST